jgi:hypothetical protein
MIPWVFTGRVNYQWVSRTISGEEPSLGMAIATTASEEVVSPLKGRERRFSYRAIMVNIRTQIIRAVVTTASAVGHNV